MSEEMTREQARDTLRNAAWLGTDEERELIEKAVELLCGEPCEKAISQQAAIDAINRLSIHDFAYAAKTGWIVRDDAVDELRQLPSVTPKQRTGHWIISPNDCFATCSECGLNGDKGIFKHYRWCPNCGARMVEPQESDHKCHTCKHYTSGENDGSCGSYICKGYSNWESEEQA